MILHLGTSDWISTYGKLNCLPLNCLFGLLFSRMQRRLIQIKAYYRLSYSVWQETSYKHLKVAAAKNSFRSVYIIDTTSFDECFLFIVKTGRHYFHANLSLPSGLVQPSCYCVLRNKCFERGPYFISVISAITLQCC